MAKKKQPAALKRYTSLRKQAKARGIVVPQGTKLEELEQLVAGTKTTAAVKSATTKRKKASRAKAKKGTTKRVPRGARTVTTSWGW